MDTKRWIDRSDYYKLYLPPLGHRRRSSLREQMAFPDAEKSIVTKEKLCDYLLNPAHPVGGTKAAWFASVGYTRQNWEELRDDLLTIATSCENFIAKPSTYGINTKQ